MGNMIFAYVSRFWNCLNFCSSISVPWEIMKNSYRMPPIRIRLFRWVFMISWDYRHARAKIKTVFNLLTKQDGMIPIMHRFLTKNWWPKPTLWFFNRSIAGGTLKVNIFFQKSSSNHLVWPKNIGWNADQIQIWQKPYLKLPIADMTLKFGTWPL